MFTTALGVTSCLLHSHILLSGPSIRSSLTRDQIHCKDATQPIFTPNSERSLERPLGHSHPGGKENTSAAIRNVNPAITSANHLYCYYGRPSFELDCTHEPQLANIHMIQLTLVIQPTFFRGILIFKTPLTQKAPLFEQRKQ